MSPLDELRERLDEIGKRCNPPFDEVVLLAQCSNFYQLGKHILDLAEAYREFATQLINRNMIGDRAQQDEISKDYSDEARPLVDSEAARLFREAKEGK